MIYAEKGKERDSFIAFIEHALGILSKMEYTSFLSRFDDSRLAEQDLIRALKYLDETRPALKIDDPTLINSNQQEINLIAFPDGNGYYMDYDLTTDGKVNDLTIQVEFRKEGNGYIVLLMNIENKGQYPSFDLFVKLITMFDVSVDQFIHADGGARSSSCRKHIDVLLNSMNEKELVVIEATAEGIKKARETEVPE